jgi:hypothetical protein
MTRGITQPPAAIGTVVIDGKTYIVNTGPQLKSHLMDVYQTVLSLRGAQEPPKAPPNFNATPLPGGNLLQWTVTDADYYQILWSASPSIAGAQQAFSGQGNQYSDIFGAPNITRWYWIYAWKNNGQRSTTPAGPLSSVSGVLTTPVTPPTPPTPGVPQVKDPRVNYPVPRGPIRTGG